MVPRCPLSCSANTSLQVHQGSFFQSATLDGIHVPRLNECVCGVRLANEGCGNKVRGTRPQLFAEESTQTAAEER